MGLLSQVERGRADPSLATLRKLAIALEVPLFDLFGSAAGSDSLRVQRADEHLHVRLPNSAVDYARVSAGLGELEVLRGELKPGSATSDVLHGHGAEECVVVITGVVVLETDEQAVTLDAGDSCHFRAQIPHRYVNNGDQAATFMISVTPPSL